MNPAMIKKMQKMQKEMVKTQKELEEKEYTMTAGGFLSITAKGTKEILAIKIDPEAIEGADDIEMLEDTLIATINNIYGEIDKEAEEAMSQFTAGLGGGLGGLF